MAYNVRWLYEVYFNKKLAFWEINLVKRRIADS